ncbi:uncharacterized protein AB675_6501 [Cyphellophora attinorum]|uniref:Clr5 domain-containing protein n=1 Tax=Cyphellophora attinorum TaxID=1664694 RepID=A0A0N1P117_9EURO|nr:uncharacterized protein AB675_6501 [Phialophora attinorum]KPI44086.1 hypothetical protein AB675_6501 [Phialophora attinorum]
MATIASNHGDAPQTLEGPTAAQWSAVKEDIRYLYLIEKKPLKHVKQILEQRRGFRATERMFKSRLNAWKFTKNSSDKEYQICAVLHKTRRDRGIQHTAFDINGNRRTLRDLFKYIKGRKMTVEDFYALAVANVTPDQLQGDGQQVRAVTPEPDEDGGHDSEGDSENDGSHEALVKLTPTSSDASNGNSLPIEQRPRRHRPSTSSSASHSARQGQWSTLEPRSVPLPSPTDAYSAHNHTPESFSISPTSVSFRPTNHLRHSPRRSFGRSDVESLAHSTIYSNPLRQSHGADNLEAWTVLSHGASDTSSLSDFDVICPRCHRTTSDHSSPCDIDSPASLTLSPSIQRNTRNIFNPTPDLPSPAVHFAVPSPANDHSWKWVSHCFSACIYYSRSRYTDLTDRNLVENTPSYATATDDFVFARYDLECADEQFRAMIVSNDPNILVAINQSVMTLGMHNWGNITKFIMGRASDVAREMLGQDHPISILARFVTLMSSGKTIYDQTEITTPMLEHAWHAFVTGWTPPSTTEGAQAQPPFSVPAEGEAGRRAIPAMYLYASALTTEAIRFASPYKEAKLSHAEGLLRHCYSLACRTFHKSHLQAIAALVKLQLVLERQNRLSEAIETISIAIEDGRSTLGTQHARQLENVRIRAELLRKRWRVEEEKEDVQSDNRHGLATINSAFATVQAQRSAERSRRRQAEQQQVEAALWEVLEGRVKILGRKHESTMQSKIDLINWLRDAGRWSADSPERQRLNDVWDWTHVSADECGGGANGRGGY